MTDNIKLPQVPSIDRWVPDSCGDRIGMLWCPDGDYVGYEDYVEALHAYARETVRLNAKVVLSEPDWRHPKIQRLIGSEARLRITIELIWQILEDPNQEFTASDMEYWGTIHDRLKEALSTKPQPAQVPDEMVLVDRKALNMAINALRRDAEDGRQVRGEMADLLSASQQPISG